MHYISIFLQVLKYISATLVQPDRGDFKDEKIFMILFTMMLEIEAEGWNFRIGTLWNLSIQSTTVPCVPCADHVKTTEIAETAQFLVGHYT